MKLELLSTFAMGTRFELVLAGDDRSHLTSVGETAIAEIEEAHARMNRFDAGSFLSYVNTHAHEKEIPLDDEMFELLQESLDVHHASDGAFDITVAPLLNDWFSFPASLDQDHKKDETDLDRPIGSQSLKLESQPRSIHFELAGLTLDLGGIAKGHALDLAAQIVRENGITCALLQGGSCSVVAIGKPPGESGWKVSMPGPGKVPYVRLCDAAMSVSAPTNRVRKMPGDKYSHIIDPRDKSVFSEDRLVAVITDTARLADAWSTALLVLGSRPTNLPSTITSIMSGGTDEKPTWDVQCDVRECVKGSYFTNMNTQGD